MAAKKKKKKSSGVPVTTVIILVVVVALGIIFGPKLIHKCDHCGDTFVGVGYMPDPVLHSDEAVICEDCAKDEHFAFVAAQKADGILGEGRSQKELDKEFDEEFKIDIFG